MSDFANRAAENFKEGYNCAQSVLLAFADEIGLDKETVLKLSSSFGGGMGRMREVCGAVSAMFMIAGLIKGYTSPDDDIAKGKHYELIQNLAKEFKTHHKTIICRELLGIEDTAGTQGTYETLSPIPSKRTEEYYIKRPCEDFIKTAASIVEDKVLTHHKRSSVI